MSRFSVAVVTLVMLSSLLSGAAAVSEAAPATTFSTMDAFVREQMEMSRIPGVAMAIIEDGAVVHARGHGDAGDGRAMTPRTLFPIGALARSMTALSIMQLVEAGTLDLDAPVRASIPWFAVADPDASATMTLRHLLEQTSGFTAQAGRDLVTTHGESTLEEMVSSLRDTEVVQPIGQRFEESNANEAVLALVIEVVSGQPYGSYLEEHIFKPLGMTSATTDREAAEQQGLTDVHTYMFGWPVDVGLPPIPAYESVFASTEDLSTYLMMLLNDGRLGGRQVLSASGTRYVLTPTTEPDGTSVLGRHFDVRHARGWLLGPYGASRSAVWQFDYSPSSNGWIVMLPDQNQAAVIMMNVSSDLPWPWATMNISIIPVGVVNLLQGEKLPLGWSMKQFYMIFDGVFLLAVILQVTALVWLARSPIPLRSGPTSDVRTLARNAAPLVWEVVLGVGIVIGMPIATGMSWPSSFESVPDLTLALFLVAGLWLLTAIVRASQLIDALVGRKRRRRRIATPAARPQLLAGGIQER